MREHFFDGFLPKEVWDIKQRLYYKRNLLESSSLNTYSKQKTKLPAVQRRQFKNKASNIKSFDTNLFSTFTTMIRSYLVLCTIVAVVSSLPLEDSQVHHKRRVARNVIRDPGLLWPEGKVYYKFDTTISKFSWIFN